MCTSLQKRSGREKEGQGKGKRKGKRKAISKVICFQNFAVKKS